MKTRLMLLTGVLTLAGVVSALAFNVDMSFDARAKFTSEYLWRGKIISDDWCFQPAVSATAEGFSLQVWGTWDLAGVSNATERTRTDLSVEYAHTWPDEKLIGRAGLISYIYKDSTVSPWHKDTFEAYVGADVLVPLLPSFTVYYDFSQIDGFYATAGLRHSFDIVKSENALGRRIKDWNCSLDLRADIGMADKNYNEKMFDYGAKDNDGQPVYKPAASLVDFTGTVSLPITIVKKSLTIEPAVKYMTLIDSKIRTSADNAGDDLDGWAYSVTLSLSF
jgi:hypothetical protein